jgi:hypothetical protein
MLNLRIVAAALVLIPVVFAAEAAASAFAHRVVKTGTQFIVKWGLRGRMAIDQ